MALPLSLSRPTTDPVTGPTPVVGPVRRPIIEQALPLGPVEPCHSPVRPVCPCRRPCCRPCPPCHRPSLQALSGAVVGPVRSMGPVRRPCSPLSLASSVGFVCFCHRFCPSVLLGLNALSCVHISNITSMGFSCQLHS